MKRITSFTCLTRSSILFALVSSIAAPVCAQTFSLLADLNRTEAIPNGLVEARAGYFWGTTTEGGSHGNGSVFTVTPFGKISTIHSFCASCGGHGVQLRTPLIQGSDGNFYGTTSVGAVGSGSIFQITPGGVVTTLHNFESEDYLPPATLVQGSDGDLYGVTNGEGIATGVFFKLTRSGIYTKLYDFTANVLNPNGPLIQGEDGNFYGTSNRGGAFGKGTVFMAAVTGAVTTVYDFCPTPECADGSYPAAGLIRSADGGFYGTTTEGAYRSNAAFHGAGTVFKITPSGALTTIYRFCSQSPCTDGLAPSSPLVRASDGNLYGLTSPNDNRVGCSVQDFGCSVFRLTPEGEFTSLHTFCPGGICADGDYPNWLIQATSGDFYGTTNYGGAAGWGTIFKLDAGLHAFVETQPAAGSAGTPVVIIGPGLANASSVTFNGTPAAFALNPSGHSLSTNVPPGATTGRIEVVIPQGTLSTTVPFPVL